MNGHVFQCFHEQNDRKQFKKTVEALGEYANKNLKFSRDLSPLFEDTIASPSIPMPQDLPTTASRVEAEVWKEEIKEYTKQRRELKNNSGVIFAVAWGQCSEAMKAKLRTDPDYVTKHQDHDCAWLVSAIRAVTLQFDSTRYPYLSLIDARASFLNCTQGQHQSPASYLSTFSA